MAELVDASDSKSGIGNNVQVRFLFWAQKNGAPLIVLSFKGFLFVWGDVYSEKTCKRFYS